MKLFLRGIILPFQKNEAVTKPIEDFHPTEALRIPLLRLDEEKQRPLSLPEEAVVTGQLLYRTDELDTPALATVAGELGGTVVLNHPLYGELLCTELHPQEDSKYQKMPPVKENELTPDEIIEIAREAAIYDELDGVALWEKLQAWQLTGEASSEHAILVADATENDIYGSAAWCVLGESPRQCLSGVRLVAKALRIKDFHIATMLPRARRRLLKRAIGRENVYIVGDEYPVTVYADGDTEVFRIGIQACLALCKAIEGGEKALNTVITVAGDGVRSSCNLRVPYGTDIQEILTYCKADKDADVILGDAMTGVSCNDPHLPLLPGITTLLVMQPRKATAVGPCIGCGRCATVCHAQLLPYEIVRRLENMHYERLQHLHPQECDGCAACSYICPAGRPVAAEVLRAGETNGTMFMNWGDDDYE